MKRGHGIFPTVKTQRSGDLMAMTTMRTTNAAHEISVGTAVAAWEIVLHGGSGDVGQLTEQIRLETEDQTEVGF